MEEEKTINLDAAARMYRKHLERMSVYQKKHKQLCRDKTQKYITKLKDETPEKYEAILEKNRKRYQEVTKPRKAQEKIEKIKKENELKDIQLT